MDELLTFLAAQLDTTEARALELKELGHHLEGWDQPDWDLRWVAAARKVVAAYENNMREADRLRREARPSHGLYRDALALGFSIRALASVYAGNEGWEEEWA